MIVHYNVDGTVDGVVAEIVQIERLHHNPLTAKCRIAVEHNGQVAVEVEVIAKNVSKVER